MQREERAAMNYKTISNPEICLWKRIIINVVAVIAL
jgi:hypothetical protein